MIMRLPNAHAKLAETLGRLRRNSIVLEVAEGDPAEAMTLTSAGVRLAAFEVDETGKLLTTPVTLHFEKDRAALFVSVNPALLAILGYTPAVSAVLTAGNWSDGSPVTVGLSDKLTAAQVKAVEDLEYLLDLHVVPVGLP
jgi:hypothetical protein